MSTVHICLNDILGVAVACEVIFYPGDTPFFNGAALTASGARSIRLDAEGNGSVALLPGRYTVRFSGITSNTDTLLIQVPNDDEIYPLSTLVCAGNWVLPMRDFLQKSKNLSDVADPAAAFDAIKQAATLTSTGALYLASQAEVDAGTDTNKAVTPATLANLAKWATAGQKLQFITTADAAARLALTSTQVNVGDVVEQADTHEVYEVLDATLLSQETGYVLVGTRPTTIPIGLTSGLLDYAPLNETGGTRADISGHGNDLSDTNSVGSTTDATFGTVAQFDGSNSLSTAASFDPKSAFTVAFLSKLDSASGYQSGAELGSSQPMQFMNWADGDSATVGFTTGDGGPVLRAAYSENPTGAHFLIFSYDPDAQIMLIQVDGQEAVTLTDISPDQITAPSGPLIVGGHFTPMVGWIARLGFWNRALCSAERAQLYNNGNPLVYPFA